MFTGDKSGDFLYPALHRAGLCDRPDSTHRGDGMTMTGCFITAAVRCAPPANRPSPDERDRCQGFMERELALLPEVRVLLALGGFAWEATLRILGAPRPWPRFGHGAQAALPDGRTLLGSYHPSQQNVFTGRLTPAMLDDVLAEAGRLRDRAGTDRGFQ